MGDDLRLALRSLRRSPAFVAVALLSLTLGIGVNTTLFSLVNASLFRPLPYAAPGQLLDLHETNPTELCAGCGVGTSTPTFLDWHARLSSFSRMGAYVEQPMSVVLGDRPERITAAVVSGDLFATLGVSAGRGRLIGPADDRATAPAVIVIGEDLWRRAWGSDPSLVGRTVRANGVDRTVIGIARGGFRFPERAQAWVPLAGSGVAAARGDRSLGVVARLKDGTALARAREDLARVAQSVAGEHPGEFTHWSADATFLRDELNRDSGPPFVLLFGAALCVLLIACANLANLQMVRAVERGREFAVRSALGAPRGRVLRLMLVESTLLALTGGLLGLVVALWGTDLVTALLPSEAPFWMDIRVDARVVTFAILASLATGVVFGIIPAWRASRGGVHEALKDGQRGASAGAGRGRLRSALVASQFALALVLLAGTGVLVKTFLRIRRTDNLGYDVRNILRADAELLDRKYDDPKLTGLFASQVLERMRALPGVQAAALSGTRFLGTFVGTSSGLWLEGASQPVPDAMVPRFAFAVTPQYFDVMRSPIPRGRGILPSDVAGSEYVVVVTPATAEALWPGKDPVGQRMRFGTAESGEAWRTVVGVTTEMVGSPLARGRARYVYVPFAQMPVRPLALQARTSGAPLALAEPLREAVAAVDRDAPLTSVQTEEQALGSYVRPVGFFVNVMGGMAALALALAALGIYGVVSYAVSQRTREIGVRIALGATTRGVMELVLRSGMVVAAIGVVVGVAGALAVTRLLRAVLFGTDPADPTVFVGVSVLLVAVALVASVVPARRAAAVNPVDALRAE